MKKENSIWGKKGLLTATAVLMIAIGGSFINFTKTEASEDTKNKAAKKTNQVSAAVPTNGRIAFVSTRHNTAGSEIYTMNADGTDVRRVTTGNTRDEFDVAWSPDGTKIAFARQLGDFNSPQIFVINADGTNETRLTNNNFSDLNPTWSPDGRKIAFTTTRDNSPPTGNTEIYVMDFDGANQTRLTNRPGADLEPDWSPDGTKIVYSRQDNTDQIYRLYVMNADGSDQTMLTTAGRSHRNPAWSPDGSKIVFLNGDNAPLEGICTINANGSGLVRIVEDSAFVGFSHTPDWSPDGSKIIFFRSSQLYTANASGGGVTQISPNGSQNTDPSWQTVDVRLPRRPKVDFNGDGKNDVAIYRPANGEWWIQYNPNGNAIVAQWGNDPSDKPVTADFNGDGATDLGIYRASEGSWWVLNSPASPIFFTFVQLWGGDPSDVPVPGDYNGDGMAELAIFRRSQGVWWITNAPAGGASSYMNVRKWGNPGDVPVAEDYDGDGKWDLAVWRPTTGDWWISYSSTGRTVVYRLQGDIPVPGDYDGDGKADYAMYSRIGLYVVRTDSGFMFEDSFNSVELPNAADYDGDGKADFAAFYLGGGSNATVLWSIYPSSSGTYRSEFFGKQGDIILSQPYIP